MFYFSRGLGLGQRIAIGTIAGSAFGIGFETYVNHFRPQQDKIVDKTERAKELKGFIECFGITGAIFGVYPRMGLALALMCTPISAIGSKNKIDNKINK